MKKEYYQKPQLATYVLAFEESLLLGSILPVDSGNGEDLGHEDVSWDSWNM